MSIKLLLTGSEDFGKAEIELDDEHASVGYLKSEQFSDLAAEVVAQQTLLAKGLKASHGLSPEPTVVTGSGSPQDNSYPQQQAAQPPAWAQQQPTNVVPLQQQTGETCTNPDGKSPAACGMALQPAETRTGKKQLKCPQYRYSSGQGGNGHRVVWL